MFVALEGVDKVGKSYLIEYIVDELYRLDITCASMQYPNRDSYVSKMIRQGIMDGASSESMASLFSLDRLYQKYKLAELRDEYDVVIADRYIASGYAYQNNYEFIVNTELDKNGIVLPNVSFWVTSDTSWGDNKDKYDSSQEIRETALSRYEEMYTKNMLSGYWHKVENNVGCDAIGDIVRIITQYLDGENHE